MKKLEKLAEELFDRHCERETGKKGNWRYISHERKVAWMEEALLSIELVVKSMQDTIKPLPAPYKFDTSWEQGRFSGQSAERISFVGYLHDTLEASKKELEIFRSNP